MKNESILKIINSATNSIDLCTKLRIIVDYDNKNCKIKNLIHNINHYALVNEDVHDISFLKTTLGDIKIISHNLKGELIKEGYKIYTVPIVR